MSHLVVYLHNKKADDFSFWDISTIIFSVNMDSGNDSGDQRELLVGDDPCTYGAICDALSTCKSAGALWPKLVDISRRLAIPEDKVVLINPWLLSGTKTHSAVLYEILEAWRGKEGKNAKLNQLIAVLEGQELRECAETLRKQFKALEGTGVTWSKLSDFQKTDIGNKLVLFQGKLIKLSKFDNLNDLDEEILAKLAHNEIPTVVNTEISQPLEYYIPRTIKSRARLTVEVFKTDSKDLFVVQGIERQQLTNLTQGGQTDVSGNQIRRLTVRFILLEYEPDFEKISNLAKNPVHWIKVQNESYYWVKSSGSTNALNKYLHQLQDSHTETELASNRNKVNILSDSPGMGKTILLLKLMEEIQQLEPTTCVRFIVLKEFLQALENTENQTDTIISWIADQSSEFEYGKKLVKKSLLSGYCVLLLDGFDEILMHQIDKAKELLQVFSGLESTRMFVTTRPHMREELEDALHVLCYTIEPFSDSDQLNFLVKYWASKGITTNKSVEMFAKSGLKSLSSQMTDFERQITGIPLQCRMLAETYLDEAERCSRLGFHIYEGDHSSSLANSVFKMYKAYIELRFKPIESDSSQNSKKTRNATLKSRFLDLIVKNIPHLEKVKRVHMYYALELLFPEEVSNYKHLLSPNRQISLNEICRYGIIEINNLNQVRFVHRTFAEFFIAMFFINEDKCKIPKKFKLRSILSTRPIENDFIIVPFLVVRNGRMFPNSHKAESEFLVATNLFQFNFPVVCYFYNEFRKAECQPDTQLINLSTLFSSSDHDKIFPVLFASAYNNYCYVLLEIYKLFSHIPFPNKSREGEIGYFLLTAARYGDAEFMKAFCDDFDSKYIRFPWVCPENGANFKMTPLHVAIKRGHYNLVEYLIAKLKTLQSERYLFHFCVAHSLDDDKVTLEGKKQIIKLLLSQSEQWLNETVDKMTPIVQNNVSFELLECLVEEGADVNVLDNLKQTVLHNICENNISPESYHQFVFKLFKQGFTCLNDRDLFSKTPLHYALLTVELFGDTVRLLHENGADFNAVDCDGKSVLFYAIQGKRSAYLIQQLVEHGGNFLHKDNTKNGILHVCSEWEHFEALQYFLEFYHMDVNSANEDFETPLHKAVEDASEEYDLIQRLLITNGANVNAKSINYQTPVLEAFHHEGLSLEILELMEQRGLIVDQKLFSDLLKAAIDNKRLTLNNKSASTLVYLIDKGGKLGKEIEQNPWKFLNVQEIMSDVVQCTNVTTELLNEAKLCNILTVSELEKVEYAGDAIKAEIFFSIVKEKAESFEIVLKIFILTKQDRPFNLLKRGLHKFWKQNQLSSSLSSDSDCSWCISDSDSSSCAPN